MMRILTHRSRVAGCGAIVWMLLGCGGGADGPSVAPPPDSTPASVTLSATGSATLSSGNTLTLTANVLTRDGRQVSGAVVTWTSTNPQVASVENGLVRAILVGTAQITAAVGSLTSAPLTVATLAGAASSLALRVQPAGAAVGSTFTTQPVVEVRDAAGNLVTTTPAVITAAVASGGGVLSGVATASTTNGIATFTDLGMTGLVGARTLSFSSPSLAVATSAPFILSAGAPAQMVITRQPVGGAVAAPLVTQPIVELRDVSGNVSTASTAQVSATLSGLIGTLGGSVTVPAVAGIATFANLQVNAQPGTYALTFSAVGIASVTSRAMVLPAIIFGLSTQKVVVLDAGATASPMVSSGSNTTFTTRAPSRVSLDNAGRMTGVSEGQGFLVASNSLGADSILAIVTRSPGGPVVRAGLSTYALPPGDTTSIDLVLEPRTTPVGAFTAIVSLNTQDFTPRYTIGTTSNPGVQIAAGQTNPNVFRFTVVTTTPISSPLVFGRLLLISGPVNSRLTLTVHAAELFASDGQDVFARATSTFYPLVFR